MQTVIIMVVLIAIAGAVAVALFSAADEASEDLENTDPSAGIFASITQDMADAAGLPAGTDGGADEQQKQFDDKASAQRRAFTTCKGAGGTPKKADGTDATTAGDARSCASS